jgi:hypothetical protein
MENRGLLLVSITVSQVLVAFVVAACGLSSDGDGGLRITSVAATLMVRQTCRAHEIPAIRATLRASGLPGLSTV